jgi:carbon storage regulator
MLVLSRKLNESIVIGDQIRITFVGLRGNHVRLGIEAPRDVTIMREELVDVAVAGNPARSCDVPSGARRDGFKGIARR